ncbi:ParB/RepB/Spo0J family partition protein [Streptomyces sp. BV286]|uniref:ParB/RepB/Spo0J family partition protein n=1 Tax=Streptomyces sp. BV286 TaxID=2849672 RepID=UPI001C2E4A8B|nr:ParB/RepB/Spo0J family partition protein [Streptomyces sp. BV286]MBV1940769.1 ParB/RepB/Spo0J family partition protein [Streptomyces sp. BV286]
MPLDLKGGPNKRGSGVGGKGTAPDQPKPAQAFYSQAEKDGDVLDIPLDQISPNPFNDLRSMGDLEGLARSIKEDGLLQDIVVMHTAEFVKKWPEFAADDKAITTKYVIAFGERRWRASKLAELRTIRSALNNAVTPKIRRVLLIENLQRVGYTPMEEARNFLRLHVKEGMSYREIAAALKIGSTHVSRRLQLVNLPLVCQEAIEAETLSVTDARRIQEAFKGQAEEQEAAWRLSEDRDIPVKQAILAVQAEGVPTEYEKQYEDEQQPEDQAGLPEQRAGSENDDAPVKTKETVVPEAPTNKEEKEKEVKQKPELKPPPVAPKSRVSVAADRAVRERNNAGADRTEACLHLIRNNFTPDEKQTAALYARTLLSPIQQGPAKTRAHAWLREVGKEVLSVADPDSYFQAVLSSGNDDLVQRATFATALAASEIRAKDNRRQWDRTDAAHVELLIQAANYVPSTEWERDQLTKFNVAFDAAEPADEPAL